MRLLHLANGNLFGGIETFLVTLARLAESGGGPRSSFILSHEGRLSAELLAIGVKVKVLPGARLRRPWAIRRVRRECRLEMKREAPDLVLAHGPWAYFVFAHGLRKEGPPVAFWQHGPASRDCLHLLAGLRRPAAVIANSDYTAATTPRVFPGMTARVIRLPMLEPQAKRSRSAVREELGAGNDVVVLQTSRFEEWKGHKLLLEALAAVPDLPWRLWYAGGQTRPGERLLRTELEELARRHGVRQRVTFLGERGDIADVLGAADIFCQPNREREPYGLGLLEALAMGLPIVATDLGATSVRISREWGREVPANARALASAMSELIGNRRELEEMGMRARAYHRENYSIGRLVAEMNDSLRAVATMRDSDVEG